MEGPQIRYAKTADGFHLAYLVTGAGPPDLVFTAGGVSNLEVYQEYPPVVRFHERLSSFARIVVFDKRGTGLSDPVPGGRPPTLEARMDDLRTVMDATGLDRAALLGFLEGNALAALFAATYPERVTALILYGPLARFRRAADYPWAPSDEVVEAFGASVEQGGDAAFQAAMVAPSLADDPTFQAWFAKLQRAGGGPGQRLAYWQMNVDVDVRTVLPSIRVPTLVLHRADDRFVPVAAGRWAAAQIPGARFVALGGRDHLPFVGDTEQLIGEVEEFLTGVRRGAPPDRVLATVMFVDIAGSTRRAAELGDAAWKRLLDDYDRRVEQQLARARGRLVKSLGDGSLATFDGPARAIRCAEAIRDAVTEAGLQVRVGLHTGEVETRGSDVGGIAVHIAQRIVTEAGPGEVLVSRTVVDLVVGSGIGFVDRGDRRLRGVPGGWRLFAVTNDAGGPGADPVVGT